MSLMDQLTATGLVATTTTTPSQTCCFNMISRWFKKRKKSLDICSEKNNNNSNFFPSSESDFFYSNMGVKTSKSASLVCNSLITDARSEVMCNNGVRRASILVTEPKSKATIQYYKKRVSFADILDVRKEFDISNNSHDRLHEDDEDHHPDDEEEDGDDSCDPTQTHDQRDRKTGEPLSDTGGHHTNNKKNGNKSCREDTFTSHCNNQIRRRSYESTAEPADDLLLVY